MKTILSLIACIILASGLSAQTITSSPIKPGERPLITELGLTFPIKNSLIKNYLTTRGIQTLPLTSGVSNGAEFGKHAQISNEATVGIVLGANAFIGTDSVAVSQLYQLSAMLIGRLYFNDSWRGGFFVELGSGPELSLAKLKSDPLVFQVNIGARFGAGYNYKFSNDVTVGLSVLTAPSLSASSLADGAKVCVSMLW